MLVPNIKVLILSGKRSQDPLSDFFGVENKALIPLAGKLMIEWVLSTVQNFGFQDFLISVDEIQKTLFEKYLPSYASKLLAVETSQSPMKAVTQVLKLLPENTGLFITTADNPLLERKYLEYFFQKAESSTAELLIGTVNGQDGFIEKYPDLKRTWHKLNSRTWLSGANMFFWSPKSINNSAHEILCKLESKRKSPLDFASVVSGSNLAFLLRLFFQRTSIQEASAVLSKTLGIQTEFLSLPFPEACIDVDKISDYEIVSKLILQKPAAPVEN